MHGQEAKSIQDGGKDFKTQMFRQTDCLDGRITKEAPIISLCALSRFVLQGSQTSIFLGWKKSRRRSYYIAMFVNRLILDVDNTFLKHLKCKFMFMTRMYSEKDLLLFLILEWQDTEDLMQHLHLFTSNFGGPAWRKMKKIYGVSVYSVPLH
jgi:hypothetical protein